MAIVLSNAMLVDLDSIRVDSGGLRIDAGRIAARGPKLVPEPGDEVVDCGGAVVLPGFVNGHTHLYSALAVGMPPPPQIPRNFLEILKFVWWRLDRALDAESIEMSARIGAIEGLRNGTTTLIDHHASPNCIAGSLDLVRKGLADIGVRGVLCYETTDRHGPAGAAAGLEENERFLARCRREAGGQFAALVGAHASFTLGDERLDALAKLAAEYKAGVHIHVAEDPCDERACREQHNMALIDRLAKHGLLRPESIFAHGTHLSPEAVAQVNAAGLTMAHNPRSNMHNAVGYAPVAAFRCPVMLGTDGIGADMFAEARSAWLISRHQHAGIPPGRVIEMLAASARRASASLGVTLGKLDAGAAADIIVTDYVPFSPLTAENLPGHFLFGMSAGNVLHVLVNGQWAVRDRAVLARDEAAVRAQSARIASEFWKRLQSIA
jgi:putative selenium metabolism protein SsnA